MNTLDLGIPILLALWIYAGRAILFCLFAQPGRPFDNIVNRLALGLMITPIIVSLGYILSNTLAAVLVLTAVTDLVLIAILVFRRKRLVTSPLVFNQTNIAALSFAGLCMVVAVFNGPFVEHLSDAWWHMRRVSEILNTNQPGPGYPVADMFGSIDKLVATLGLDASSYRLQAMVARAGDTTVLQAWYGSTVVVCGLLGASFYFLVTRVLPTTTARIVALGAWLLILGGMNTGFRLTGWPAGMGYVFLNLGLLASYSLWAGRGNLRQNLVLLFASVAGMGLFHFAEIYILAMGLALLAMVWLVRLADGFYQLLGILLLAVAGTGLIWWFGNLAGTPPPMSAVVTVILMVACLWGAVCLAKMDKASYTFPLILLLVGIAGYIGIDWPHFIELFRNSAETGKSYYSAYIPKYLPGLIDNGLRIPKWEHQLRASTLWTGAFAVFTSPFLYWRYRDDTSLWLATLCIGTAVVLLSPPLFSLAVTLIPPYGGYRIQYLIPTALTIGLTVSCGVQLLTTSIKAGAGSGNTVSGSAWTKRTGGMVLVLVSAAAVYPDLATRFGIIADRPWAVYSNLNFHWRWADNRRSINTHTSWRYTKDIGEIRKLTNSEPGRFVSDLATSYYIAAETLLRPVVQQSHHSNSGQRNRALFDDFCAGRITADRLHDTLKNTGTAYVVLNHDTKNYTAEVNGTSCVGETDHAAKALDQIAVRIYDGEYLSLWALEK